MPTFSERFSQIPPQTVTKVNGVTSEAGFLHIGSCIADAIEAEIGALGNFSGRTLDFGCGLGRVMTQLERRSPRSELVGFDIDPMMLKWCGLLMEGSRARLVFSTLDLPDESFDLIIAISVFTHLDRTTDFWLAEIQRLLRPEGRAFLTYQDETLFAEMAERQQMPGVALGTTLTERHIVAEGSPEGGAAMGTFYSTAYWERIVSRFFVVRRTKPRGLFGHQSYSLVSRGGPTSPEERLLFFRTYAAEIEKQLFELRGQHGIIY
jgi:ubiquinone/menaquinone biosynthesis C-methylase UbiE